MGFSCDDGDEQ